MSGFEIFATDEIDAIIEPYDWPFPQEREPEIAEIWTRETARTASMFNGRVLIQHRGERDGRVFRAGYSPTDYRSFLGWMRLGNPPPLVRNGFAMAALQARDGAFLLGEMGRHTANPGKIYFAAGTPDLGDVVDGRVDLAGSVLRELGEETGLLPADVTVEPRWTSVMGTSRIAFMRPVRIDLPAEEARALMLERMKRLEDEELVDIHIVRGAADLDEGRMPTFQIAFLRHAFGFQPPG
ncbi:MAG: NUDIX hydrolase [Methylobacterium sp.]|nr:NUDIX hydrolase [Methylobacterium sp.]MCA3602211.1 NUDIX hydrolase [Methylobacterium sp.]MCA3614988.1 NUDIX hydrolase [Methylobacterium sp.]MCA4909771.1 NUDIX hydrolase [Methylobacterium sp.]